MARMKSHSQKSVSKMDRRALIATAGGLSSLTLLHSTPLTTLVPEQHGAYTPHHPALVETANDCVHTGEVCLDHCFGQFQQGDTTLAKCASLVRELVACCEGLSVLAICNSRHLLEYVKVSRKICEDCEKECRRHEDHHQPCKDCADSCAACMEECDRLIG
jgi:Cys-rich four helix bundle protein (predicted Tat secretion target)